MGTNGLKSNEESCFKKKTGKLGGSKDRAWRKRRHARDGKGWGGLGFCVSIYGGTWEKWLTIKFVCEKKGETGEKAAAERGAEPGKQKGWVTVGWLGGGTGRKMVGVAEKSGGNPKTGSQGGGVGRERPQTWEGVGDRKNVWEGEKEVAIGSYENRSAWGGFGGF